MALDLETLERADMTQTQLQIWVAQMLAGRKPVFNMGMAIEIFSELDEDLFRQAFDSVVAASDNLRSIFRFEEGGPRRVVLEPDQLGYELLDEEQGFGVTVLHEEPDHTLMVSAVSVSSGSSPSTLRRDGKSPIWLVMATAVTSGSTRRSARIRSKSSRARVSS